MLTAFTAIAFGYYLRRLLKVALLVDGAEYSDICLTLRIDALGDDLRTLWQVFSTVAAQTMAKGRITRAYINVILIPWAAGYGLHLPIIPALELPPSRLSLIDSDALEARVTEGLAKSIA